MPPSVKENEFDHNTGMAEVDDEQIKLVAPQAGPRKYDIVYRNLLTFGYWHVAGLYGIYLCFVSAKWKTIILGNIFITISITNRLTLFFHPLIYSVKIMLTERQ